MSESGLILLGAGGHARACIDVIEQVPGFKLGGLVGEAGEVGRKVLDYPVLATDADLPVLRQQYECALVAVGQIHTAKLRRQLFSRAEAAGFHLPVIISPHAWVSRHASLAEGTIVMHGAIVNAGASIGRNCIINSHALVEHDAQVADHCHISTAAVLNGGVTVEQGCFVGSGSIVREGVRLGENSLVGMGAMIRHDLAAGDRVPGGRK
ncbi:acetyltransferase [Thiolapillus brandeum]|uniref:PglD N-terminal domain-containing protein n=1 Tax=Thiolapillus brandeum TaxID=1076588 RepID=A0A7U6GHE9_9GAMM|nr:acetyltransferase [Thiolapillus brandeum]BAO43677.1 conserved hypothetical protein [Thiolapillus brandeum]